MTHRPRLAVVVSHPIQYFAPLYRALARSGLCEFRAFFASRIGVETYRDVVMGADLAWKTDLLGGYHSEFLSGAEGIRTIGFREVDNPGVGEALAAFRPDAVIINGYGLMTMLRALAWCRLNGVPAIMLSDSSVSASQTGIRPFLKRLLGPVLLRQFSAFLTMSDRSEAYLQGLGVRRAAIFRTPPMIDEAFWRARDARAERRRAARAELGIKETDVTLIYVGKLYAGKRVSDLIAAANSIASEMNDISIRVLIVGNGEDRLQLEALASKGRVNVDFLGFVNIDHLPNLYCAADVLVHPAELEQYGMVALEAAVIGLPLVLSDRVGALGSTSIAQPGVNTITFPCGDVGALSAALARLMREDGLHGQMSQASLVISAGHSGAESVARIMAAVEAVASRRLSEHA